MKSTSFLGLLLTAGGVVATGEVSRHTIFSSSNETTETPDLKPALTETTTSLGEAKVEEALSPSHQSHQEPSPAPEEKTPPNKKQQLIEKIRDYTVKIVCVSSTSGFGTGWFLDYELPSDRSKYPTKWFVATNIHVIDACPFLGDPYKQKPKVTKKSQDSGALHLYRWDSGGNDEDLLRSKGIDFEDPIFWSSEGAKSYKLYSESLPKTREAKTATEDEWNKKKEIPSSHIEIPDAKLLYSALDDLTDEEGPVYSFMDFAVMEINFPDEKSARRMTEQVYDKPENERIKVIGDVKENSQFYTAGYPGNSFNPFRSVGNYSANRDRASKRGGCFLFPRINIQYRDGNSYKNRKCHYQLDNFYSRKGSSGSMIVDEEGTILGLHTIGSQCQKLSYVQPLRGVKRSACDLFSHCKEQEEYDLIVGSDSQNTSYKEQLLKYLPGTNTYLKDKYNWQPTSTTKK